MYQESEKLKSIIDRLHFMPPVSGADIYSDIQLHAAIIQEMGTNMKRRFWAIEQLKNQGLIVSSGVSMWKIGDEA